MEKESLEKNESKDKEVEENLEVKFEQGNLEENEY